MVNAGCADVSKMRRSTRFKQPFGASSSCVRSFPLKIQARKQTSRRIEKPAQSRYRQGWFIEGAVPHFTDKGDLLQRRRANREVEGESLGGRRFSALDEIGRSHRSGATDPGPTMNEYPAIACCDGAEKPPDFFRRRSLSIAHRYP